MHPSIQQIKMHTMHYSLKTNLDVVLYNLCKKKQQCYILCD